MPEISYDLRLESDSGREDGSPSMYAVLVTDPVSQQPKPGCTVHIELKGRGSLEAGQTTASQDGTTREDGKAYFTWWPSAEGLSTAGLLIRVDEPDCLLEVISLTPQREDDLTESSTTTVGPDRDAIERRAYELYEERGMEPGHEAEDWQRAEAELDARDRY